MPVRSNVRTCSVKFKKLLITSQCDARIVRNYLDKSPKFLLSTSCTVYHVISASLLTEMSDYTEALQAYDHSWCRSLGVKREVIG